MLKGSSLHRTDSKRRGSNVEKKLLSVRPAKVRINLDIQASSSQAIKSTTVVPRELARSVADNYLSTKR